MHVARSLLCVLIHAGVILADILSRRCFLINGLLIWNIGVIVSLLRIATGAIVRRCGIRLPELPSLRIIFVFVLVTGTIKVRYFGGILKGRGVVANTRQLVVPQAMPIHSAVILPIDRVQTIGGTMLAAETPRQFVSIQAMLEHTTDLLSTDQHQAPIATEVFAAPLEPLPARTTPCANGLQFRDLTQVATFTKLLCEAISPLTEHWSDVSRLLDMAKAARDGVQGILDKQMKVRSVMDRLCNKTWPAWVDAASKGDEPAMYRLRKEQKKALRAAQRDFIPCIKAHAVARVPLIVLKSNLHEITRMLNGEIPSKWAVLQELSEEEKEWLVDLYEEGGGEMLEHIMDDQIGREICGERQLKGAEGVWEPPEPRGEIMT